MKSGIGILALGLFGLASAQASAQSASFNVDSGGNLTVPDATLKATQKLTTTLPASVNVTCADGGCASVTLTVEGNKVNAAPVSAGSALFPIAALPKVPAKVVVARSAGQSFQFELTPAGAAGGGAAPSLADEYKRCSALPSRAKLDAANANARTLGEGYDSTEYSGLLGLLKKRKPRVAVFIVTPTGRVLQRPAHIDEGHVVVVSIFGSQLARADLEAKRTSAIRDTSVIRVVGEDADTSKITLQALTDTNPADCDFKPGVLGDDFAPGKGTFDLLSFSAGKAVSSFEFGVEALYDGMFALGPMRTEAIDPDFYLSSDGTTQTIRQRNLGDDDILYAVTYTPFIWEQRSLRDPPPALSIRRLNPTIGLVMNDVADNVILGVSYDLPVGGFVLTYGKHWRRVSRLDPASGLAPGSAFTGTLEQLPVGKEWEDEKFVALTIDLRVAAKFFQKALKSAAD